jgi:hypothetical protein
MFLWFAQGILVNAIRRYHTIRSLHAEICSIVDWYAQARTAFANWKKLTIDKPSTGPSELLRITWDMPIPTTVYDSAQEDIRATLWKKEIPRLYSVYLGFIQLHKRFEVLAREIDTAKRDGRQLEDLPRIKRVRGTHQMRNRPRHAIRASERGNH